MMASSFAVRESAAFPHIYPFISPDLQLWRLLTHYLFFPSAVEAALGMLLFYKLRTVERRIGSPAYAVRAPSPELLLHNRCASLCVSQARFLLKACRAPSGADAW